MSDLGSVAKEIQKIMEEQSHHLPRGSFLQLQGQVQTMRTSFTRLTLGMLFAVIFVYLLMAVNFQSWTDPFIILTALPGVFVGILWMLFMTQTTFSVPSLMGAIMSIGVATANALPNFNRFSLPNFNGFSLPNFNRLSSNFSGFSLPNFSRFAAQPPHETASAPIPNPVVSTLKDIQLSQQQNAAVLVSLTQSFATQQADLREISRQLSSLAAQADALQSAVTPLTTSSIPHPNTRARVVGTSRKVIPPLPKPVGPVSVGGAPLSPAPAAGSGAG